MSQPSPDSEQQLFDEYSSRLIRLASAHIHPKLQQRFDGEDVVQSVFRTLFRRVDDGKLQIEGSQQLWKLLVTLTVRKTQSQARRHTAEKRDAGADEQLEPDLEGFDRQPLAEDALALWEELDLVLDGLPDRATEIVAMRLEGMHRTEIAKQLNLSRQSIHRILGLVEERLEKRFDTLSGENK